MGSEKGKVMPLLWVSGDLTSHTVTAKAPITTGTKTMAPAKKTMPGAENHQVNSLEQYQHWSQCLQNTGTPEPIQSPWYHSGCYSMMTFEFWKSLNHCYCRVIERYSPQVPILLLKPTYTELTQSPASHRVFEGTERHFQLVATL